MTYKGESTGKKHARLTFWNLGIHAFGRLFDKNITDMRFLVLASKEGGDVSTLLGMGASICNIVACDRDGVAAHLFRNKFPEVPFFHGDICEAAHANRGIDFALLDFCGEVTDAALFSALRVRKRCLGADGMLGLCFQRGREVAKDSSRAEALSLAKRFRSSCPDIRDTIDLSRAVAAANFLIERGSDDESQPVLIYAVNYHSRTPHGAGVPMTMFALAWLPHETVEAARNARPESAAILGCVDTTKWKEFELRHHSVSIATSINESRAHELLNVPRATWCAWKAHASRGTYGSGRTGAWRALLAENSL